MKAVVLGGAGVEGSYAVKCLAESNTFSEICIADINREKGEELSKTNEKLDYKYLDVTDKQNLSLVIEDADVVVNCVGPFYKYAPLILETTIAKGINYVDICDDYDATQIILDKFHKEAEKAGVTCIIGLGASPGLTNILAAYSAEKLTSVKDITVYVTRGLQEEAGGAIPYHMLHCWIGEIPVFRNGRFEKARGLVDGKEYTKFPEPFGETAVYYFGHPETVTLPRYIQGVENVCCKGTFIPNEFREALLQVEAFGLLSDQPILVKGHEITPLDFTASFIGVLGKRILSSGLKTPIGGSVMVKVVGEKDGEPMMYQYAGTARMKEGTATPAAVGVEMLAKNEITKHGVYALEGCIPPEKFLNNLVGREGFGDVFITIQQKFTGELL